MDTCIEMRNDRNFQLGVNGTGLAIERSKRASFCGRFIEVGMQDRLVGGHLERNLLAALLL
jgi:hypothetical protein